MERAQTPFAEARVLASRALDLAQRHRVPPFPRAYEVWFTYASGANPGLRDRLDTAMREQGTVPPGLIDQLHAEYLSPNALNAGVERIGDRVDSDLGAVIDLLEGGVENGERLARVLDTTERSLAKAKSREEQDRYMASLRDEARQQVRACTRLGENLDRLRTEFISMQRELRELRQSVLLDQLTQLPNRRFYDDAMQRFARETLEGGRGAPDPAALCLVILDLDHFSTFNERWGRKAGDQVLMQCAAMLRRVLKDGDIATRIDGDRFALLLRDVGLDAAVSLAEGLRRAVSEIRMVSTATNEAVASLSASIGVAALTAQDTAARLQSRAESALYEAKIAGRNRVAKEGVKAA
ncbi:MAG: GGDEF domain-containing protein [Pseudomonadota bacterium]